MPRRRSFTDGSSEISVRLPATKQHTLRLEALEALEALGHPSPGGGRSLTAHFLPVKPDARAG